MRSTPMIVLGLVACAAGGFGLLAYYLPISHHIVLIAAALSPYLLLGPPIAALLFMLGRRWILSIAAIGLTLAAVLVQLPLFISENAGSGAPIRVMTANLYLGQADAKSVVMTAEAGTDLLAVQELTPSEEKRLSAAGLDKAFPYRKLEPRDEASGTGLWSRFPIVESHVLRGYNHATISMRIHLDGVKIDPTILVAHLSGPWPQRLDAWSRELNQWRDVLRDAAAATGAGCVIAAGDFNSTLDMDPFRQLLVSGFRDAAEQAGSGITATYPANMWVPPLIAIDHVLTHQCSATSTETEKVPGSDHKALISLIEIPSAG